MTKYNSRYDYQISSVNNSKNREDSWLRELDANLKKQAVQPRRVDQSMFDQINGIIGGSKSRYNSVEDAVKEMQSRSGFLDYIKRANQDQPYKGNKPKILAEHPEIESTIKNYCESTKGEYNVPAIIEYVKGIHGSDVKDSSSWEEDSFIRYLHDLNEKNKVNHDNSYQNLGKIYQDKNDSVDPANNDAFHGLMPVKS